MSERGEQVRLFLPWEHKIRTCISQLHVTCNAFFNNLYKHTDDRVFDDFQKIFDHFPKIFEF